MLKTGWVPDVCWRQFGQVAAQNSVEHLLRRGLVSRHLKDPVTWVKWSDFRVHKGSFIADSSRKNDRNSSAKKGFDHQTYGFVRTCRVKKSNGLSLLFLFKWSFGGYTQLIVGVLMFFLFLWFSWTMIMGLYQQTPTCRNWWFCKLVLQFTVLSQFSRPSYHKGKRLASF